VVLEPSDTASRDLHGPPGVGDVVNAECGIKVPVTTPSEAVAGLREAILSLARDSARLATLRQGAVERARQFTWEGQGHEIVVIYNEVLFSAKEVLPETKERLTV